MPGPAYMPFYVSDYMADTYHLDVSEHGAYLLLIMTYWQSQEPLPDNDRKLAKLARMTIQQWTEVRETLEDFFEIGDGVWRHKRVDAEIEKYADKSRKASKAARARSKNAQRNDGECTSNASMSDNESNADDERTHSGRNADAQRTMCQSESESESEGDISPNGDTSSATEKREARKQVAEGFKQIYVDELGDILPVPTKLNEQRISAANARWRDECGRDYEAFRSACQKARASAFLRGESGRGSWKGATFDWLLKPTNFTRVIEGNYDDTASDSKRAPFGDDARRGRDEPPSIIDAFCGGLPGVSGGR